ncbi:MAG: cyclomaltodextrinase N-terminal domain-containing protein, partial [Alistipes sp.]|nr:cyclomaltodextrinase N-terminal domain-containing protein [Alistipes sp.]
MAAVSCQTTPPATSSATEVEVATEGRLHHVEPLSWWVGMNTPLQLLLHGDSLSMYEVRIEGEGARITGTHRADSPNYLFADVEIDPTAEPGTRYLVFSREGDEFKVPYELAARREGSRERQSFTTADVIYLLMPDRFANGSPETDSTPSTIEKADRDFLHGRHGGDLQGMIDHLDHIADLGMTAIWSTPLLLDNEPIFSYHGYACGDYYHLDPRMGSNELYREYVAEAHKRDLKIIMDIVTNHCGISHWWMKDLPFTDWVHQFDEFTRTNNLFSTNMDPNASQYDLMMQESAWFDTSMPDMNLDNPYLLHYFKQWAVWWIEY